MSEIKLIVGLGNPGDKYADTRHNAGEWLIERLARRFNVTLNAENKFFGKVGKTLMNGKEIRFLVPTTFMNLSGKAVGALANFYRIKPEEILVLHDELDLPPGCVKLKLGGGHGGHNGLKDIVAALGNNNNFYLGRIVAIGRNSFRWECWARQKRFGDFGRLCWWRGFGRCLCFWIAVGWGCCMRGRSRLGGWWHR